MILVIGTGVAGLVCALAAARADAGAEIRLVTPGAVHGGDAAANALVGGNTSRAQGGIAAALGPGDGTGPHLADTLHTGAGIVDAEAATVLVTSGARAVQRLLDSGLPVDSDQTGAPLFGREAAHSRPRIVHAGGDRSGAILHAHLLAQVRAEPRIRVCERRRISELVAESGVVTGAVLRHADGRTERWHADAVILATGGYAALYPRTSNHGWAQGAGIVCAARAGALMADLEFVQFHPTALAGTGALISEAVRGAGAVLRDGRGHRFLVRAHPAAELAPRDVVSREIHRTLRERGESVVWLDATGVEREGGSGTLSRRFPTISAALRAEGFDWTQEVIPVAPAAHYTMGGILSDLDGRSSVPGLFVAGEVAATGVHGANRLASNSLLEGLVFGERAGRAAAAFARSRGSWRPRGTGFARLADAADRDGSMPLRPAPPTVDECAERVPAEVAAAVGAGLGIERDAAGLAAAERIFTGASGPAATLALMIAASASAREESRGSHQRADFPDPVAAASRRRAFRFSGAASAHTRSIPTDPSELRSFVPC